VGSNPTGSNAVAEHYARSGSPDVACSPATPANSKAAPHLKAGPLAVVKVSDASWLNSGPGRSAVRIRHGHRPFPAFPPGRWWRSPLLRL